MKKILFIIGLILLLPFTAVAVTAFNSSQVGSNPANGYILQTNGSISTWVPNSGGTAGGLGWASTTVPDSNSIYSTALSNVGIGTTSPGQKLSVGGDILGNNIIAQYFTATTTLGTSTIPNLYVPRNLVVATTTSVERGVNYPLNVQGKVNSDDGYEVTKNLAQDNQTIPFKVNASDPRTGPFGIGHIHTSTNDSSYPKDEQISFGYNMFNNNISSSTIGYGVNLNIESWYAPNPNSNAQTEVYFQSKAKDGTVSRPFGFNQEHQTNDSTLSHKLSLLLQGDNLTMTTTANAFLYSNQNSYNNYSKGFGIGTAFTGTDQPTGLMEIDYGTPASNSQLAGVNITRVEKGNGLWFGNLVAISEGTRAAPTAALTTTIVPLTVPLIYDGTVWRNGATVLSAVTSVTNNTSVGSELQFRTGINTGDSSTGSKTGLIQRAVISDTGKFGIGTTTPYAEFSVRGNSDLGSTATAGLFTATTSTASTFPYASTTALTVGNLVSGNCVQAGTGGLLTTIGSACGAGGGGSLSDWNKQLNYNVLTLTPTTTLPVWIKDQLFASSSAIIAGDVTANTFISTSTTVASIFPSASTTQLSVAGNTYFPGTGIWNSSGSVGVGTSSPKYPLEVIGDLGISTTGAVAPQLRLSRSGLEYGRISVRAATTAIGSNQDLVEQAVQAAGSIQFFAGGTTAITGWTIASSTGNMTFGGVFPVTQGKLNIYNADNGLGMIINRDVNTHIGAIGLQTNATNNWLIGERGTTDNNYRIYDYSTGVDQFLIDYSTGNVGLGTTTPIATFQVTDEAANATTSIQFGKPGQNKGTCLTYYDTAGTPVYSYIQAGSTAFTNTSTKPSGCQN